MKIDLEVYAYIYKSCYLLKYGSSQAPAVFVFTRHIGIGTNLNIPNLSHFVGHLYVVTPISFIH